MHKVCVQLPKAVIRSLWKHNAHLLRSVVHQFATQIAAQGWGFDYVDKLANACVRIWNAVQDPKVRAAVTFALVEVSVSHNRWKAMSQAADMVNASNLPGLDMEVALSLEPAVGRLKSLNDKLNRSKLGPHVVALLDRKDL